MPRGAKKGERRGGRQKGSRNKSADDIRELIRDAVDFHAVILAARDRSIKGSEPATKLLFEYGYGRPKEIGSSQDIKQDELTNALAVIGRAMVQNPGQGVESSDSPDVQGKPS